jgi:cyclophilin family peptidyl-prolyl cis-trans isomerase
VTHRGEITVALFPEEAPAAVASLARLATRRFFKGLRFHRVEPNFVVQGGDPQGSGWGGPGYTLPCELSPRPYVRGSVGMALSGRDTGGSQFFITMSRQPHLDGRYTQVGRVVKGMAVAGRLQVGDEIKDLYVP